MLFQWGRTECVQSHQHQIQQTHQNRKVLPWGGKFTVLQADSLGLLPGRTRPYVALPTTWDPQHSLPDPPPVVSCRKFGSPQDFRTHRLRVRGLAKNTLEKPFVFYVAVLRRSSRQGAGGRTQQRICWADCNQHSRHSTRSTLARSPSASKCRKAGEQETHASSKGLSSCQDELFNFGHFSLFGGIAHGDATNMPSSTPSSLSSTPSS